MISVPNRISDTAMRTVNARTVRKSRRRGSASGRFMKNSPENRLISTISSSRMMTSLKNMTGLCTAFAGFRPGYLPTLLMLALVALFVNLGQWQWHKAGMKAAAQALLEARAQEPPLSLPALPIDDAQRFHYRKVAAHGHYRATGQILLDNQMMEEQVGYRVLTPFVIDGNGAEVLVDRGWVPAGADRSRLPAVAAPPAPTFLAGTAVVPSDKHFALAADTAPPGGDARWQFLDLARYAREAKVALQPVIVRLDPNQPGGYLRVWPRPDDRIERHRPNAG